MKAIGTLVDMLSEAWSELWRARTRTLLAMAGVIVGSAALALPVTLYYVTALVRAKQDEGRWIRVDVPSPSNDPLARRPHLKRTEVFPEDAEAVRRECPSMARVVLLGGSQATFKAGREWRDGSVGGTDAVGQDDLLASLGWDKLLWGRGFTAEEVRDGRQVTVINQGIWREMLNSGTQREAFLRINGVRYLVIGVAQQPGIGRPYPMAAVPARSLEEQLSGGGWMLLMLPRKGKLDEALTQVDATLMRRIGDPGTSFARHNIAGGQTEGRLFTYMGFIGLLALMSSAVAISNKTYIDVLERIGQIALRRAVGATRQRIYGTVMLESVLLCGSGSLGGVGISALAFAAILWQARQWGNNEVIPWPILPMAAIVVFVVTLGTMAGMQAAALAAKANPAEVLMRKDVV